MKKNIPEPTIIRLSQIYRYMEELEQTGKKSVHSSKIGEKIDTGAHSVRKDISYIGEIGKKSAGYNVKELKNHIYNQLGFAKTRKTCVVGLGRLGSAILNYGGFLNSL